MKKISLIGIFCNPKLTPVKKYLLLISISLLYGCSWQQYFFISNESKSEIELEYELKDFKNGFPIFETNPLLYKLNSAGDADWDRPLPIADKDTSGLTVKVILPPNSIIKLGQLSNDNYKKYNQYFINGRVFNLKRIIVTTNGNATNIVPESFDNFFKKENDGIIYRIK